jgi:DNA-binding beta-propeller fold protein YncE
MNTTRHLAASLVVSLVAVAASAQDITKLSLSTKDLLYDKVSERLYASIPGNAGVNGNSVVVINPGSHAIGPFIPVGSEPGKLAVSDDGQHLYVGLDGAAAVRVVHVPTLTAGQQFPLGNDPFFGPLYPEDMAVQPGNSLVLAVSRKRLGVSPRHGGVGIYVDGLPLPKTTPDHTGSNVIEWSANRSTLYGLNNETTEFGFRQMLVDAMGVMTTSVKSTALAGFGVDIHLHAGVVYSTNGRAIDPATGATLGTFPGVSFARSVVADAALDRVYFLQGSTIQVYKASDFTLVENLVDPGVSGDTGSLVRWGVDGLAFRTTGDQVILVTESPVRAMDILPRSGTFLSTQGFDLGMIVTAPGTTIASVSSISIDGRDFTRRLQPRLRFGSVATGEETVRCPDLGGAAGLLPGEPHTIQVRVALADGTSVTDTVSWAFLQVMEQ